ncbi:MAG: hypothetical protein K2W95_31660 [Candidatus Obscuribacterales bacterium]|nr:hypothetical protein [Candidatus Obscuribacterales bacterium]
MLQAKQLTIFCLLAAFTVAGNTVFCQEPQTAQDAPEQEQLQERKPTGNATEPEVANAEEEDAGPQLEVDDRIKIKVTPVVIGPVIDRVTETATVTVRAPGASKVEVYVEPVDAPYGGRTIGEPRLLGRSSDIRCFTVNWAAPEPDKYVRVYAIAYRSPAQPPTRSRGTDLGMGGRRLVIPPPKPAAAPPSTEQTPPAR